MIKIPEAATLREGNGDKWLVKKVRPRPPRSLYFRTQSLTQIEEQCNAWGADERFWKINAIRGISREQQIDFNNKCQKVLKRTKNVALSKKTWRRKERERIEEKRGKGYWELAGLNFHMLKLEQLVEAYLLGQWRASASSRQIACQFRDRKKHSFLNWLLVPQYVG